MKPSSPTERLRAILDRDQADTEQMFQAVEAADVPALSAILGCPHDEAVELMGELRVFLAQTPEVLLARAKARRKNGHEEPSPR